MKSKKFEDEFKPIIPANIDPIKLADKIKKGMTTRFMKRYKAHLLTRSRSCSRYRLAQQS